MFNMKLADTVRKEKKIFDSRKKTREKKGLKKAPKIKNLFKKKKNPQ